MPAPEYANLHARARACLLLGEPSEKCAAVDVLREDFAAGRVLPVPGYDCAPVLEPGRPARPRLVPPAAVPRRTPHTREGHAALIHAICHIEFNAINLALDCCCRYATLPPEFHAGWLQVAWEESTHYRLLAARLAKLGFGYGDFEAHDGLLQMALKTAADPLARMALVPRVLEARGLDATPPIMAKLGKIGDQESLDILAIILRDEIGHVRLGDTWFRRLCAERGLEPEATFRALIAQFDAPAPQPPFNAAARLAAGFTADELAQWDRTRN